MILIHSSTHGNDTFKSQILYQELTAALAEWIRRKGGFSFPVGKSAISSHFSYQGQEVQNEHVRMNVNWKVVTGRGPMSLFCHLCHTSCTHMRMGELLILSPLALCTSQGKDQKRSSLQISRSTHFFSLLQHVSNTGDQGCQI